jgi:uncharacterized protein YbcI
MSTDSATQIAPSTSSNDHSDAHDGHAGSSDGHASLNRGPSNGEALSAISRRVVGLLKEHSGKGPVKARAYYWGELLVVLMTGGYTTIENTLLEEGRSKAVMDQRAEFQDVMMPHLKLVIEQELGREVIACMNSSHYAPDFNAELFVLAPREETGVATDRSLEESSSNGGVA